MQFVDCKDIDSCIVIPRLSEVEANFLPLLFENEKRSGGSEIARSLYDPELKQLIIIFKKSESVKNVMRRSNRIEYNGQNYIPFQIDKRKVFLKTYKKNLDEFTLELLVENLFQDLNNVKPVIKEVKENLLLICVDQNIYFEPIIKRISNFNEIKCSIHNVALSDSNNYKDIYFNTNNLLKSVLRSSQNNEVDSTASNVKKLDGECQTDTEILPSNSSNSSTSNISTVNENNLIQLVKSDKDSQTDKIIKKDNCCQTDNLIENNVTITIRPDTNSRNAGNIITNEPPRQPTDNTSNIIINNNLAAQSTINDMPVYNDSAIKKPIKIEFPKPIIQVIKPNTPNLSEDVAGAIDNTRTESKNNIAVKNQAQALSNLSKNKHASRIDNEENLTECIACHEDLNNIRTNVPNEDTRYLNSVLAKRVDNLEDEFKKLKDLMKELSSKKEKTTTVPQTRNIVRTNVFDRLLNSSDDEQSPRNRNRVGQSRNEDVFRPIAREDQPRIIPRAMQRLINNNNNNNASNDSNNERYLEHQRALEEHRNQLLTRIVQSPFQFSNNSDAPETDRNIRMLQRNMLERRLRSSNNLTTDQINRFPTAKYQSKNGGVEDKCPICLDDLKQNDELRILGCFDKFHISCIDRWLSNNNKCPCCKYDLLKYLNDEN